MRNVIKGFTVNTGKGLTRHATPAARLAMFRALAASYPNNDWRTARAYMHALESAPLSPGFNTRNAGTKYETRTPIMYGFCGPQFRKEEYADKRDDVRTDHSGWYTDADCSATLRTFVFNLPGGRFGGGYADSDTGHRVYLLDVFDDAQDAYSNADSEAEYQAEESKEYSERWDAAHELRDDIDDLMKAARRLYVLRNAGVDDDVRAELSDTIDAIRTKRDTLANDYNDIEV